MADWFRAHRGPDGRAVMIAGRQCDDEPLAWVTFVGCAGGQERYAVCWSHLYGLEFVTGQETMTRVQARAERGLTYALAGHRYTRRAVGYDA